MHGAPKPDSKLHGAANPSAEQSTSHGITNVRRQIQFADSTVQRSNASRLPRLPPLVRFRLPETTRCTICLARLMDVLPPIPSPLGPRWRRCWHGLSQGAIFFLICVGAALAWKQMAHPTSFFGQVEVVQAGVASSDAGLLTNLWA